jgi:glutamine amidotransferase
MSGSVAVIDYGMGNLHSVESALAHVGAEQCRGDHDPERLRAADRVVFPGRGRHPRLHGGDPPPAL